MDTIREYCFQTRCAIKTAYADLKRLQRKDIIYLKGDNEESILIREPLLLSILTDCFLCKQTQSPYYPFHLSSLEKEGLIFLSKYSSSESLKVLLGFKILKNRILYSQLQSGFVFKNIKFLLKIQK